MSMLYHQPRQKRPEAWEIQVGEELKITVSLSLKKLTMNDNQKELEFPSSLTAEERKYIHLLSQQMGFKSKSRGKGSMRYLTVYKREGSTIMSKEALLKLGENSRSMILGLLQRCPVTNKERQDLLPGTEKDRLMNPELRDLNLVRSLGRLTPGPPQVPPLPGHSEVTAEARMLPVWSMKDQLLSAINHNQIILVRGETGSGKTTQVPQIILQESSTLNKPCRVFCTQPRRISALSIAERVSAERGEKVGYTVGYQIRLEGKLSPKTLLTFCTTGVLLRTLMGGESALATVTHILVDEVHERDRFTDFLLTVLRDCLPKFRHLKLILMSASLDAHLYAKYFNNCPVIDIPGKTYMVKPYYLEDILKYTNYQTPRMLSAQKQLQMKARGMDEASEWTRNIIKNLKSTTLETSETVESKNNKSPSNDKSSSYSEKAKENDPSVREDMDRCIEKAFTSGEDEYFSQMLYLIMSENVSPDYQHSSTWASPLMVAAGRGRIDYVEQLLALGASVNLKAANEWSAADWAQSTGQQETIDFLKSFSACEGIDLKTSNLRTIPSNGSSSQVDKELVEAYNLSQTNKNTDVDLIFALCLKIHVDQPPGGILIFLPGYEDIVTLRDNILAEDKQFNQGGKYALFCLHSHMQSSDQKRVFRSSPAGVRKIVLSTNIAETSITINDIVYVIDCGKVKEVSFDAISGISCLKAVWVSQASAIQRRGRAGRCQPGISYHLFSKSSFNLLQPHQTPEILRSPLQDLCLHTKLLAMPNMLIADFLARAPEPPAFMAVKNAVHLLKSMDALDPWEDVTELGHHLLDLPLPPHLGKMVITSTILKCLDPILTIAACLAYRDPFALPTHPSDKKNAKNIRKKFSFGTFSDHMVLLKAFQAWQKACTEQWQRNWCDRNFVSGATMEMVHGMRAQVLAQLRSSGFVRARGPGDIRDVNSNSDNWAVVKAALLSGIYPNLIRVDREQKQLRTEKESKVRLHSSSVLLDFNGDSTLKENRCKNLSLAHRNLVGSLPCDWLLYDEMVRIGLVAHVKTVTLVSPLCVLLMAGPMRLPLDALSEPSHRGYFRAGLGGDMSSDSESEERPEGMNCFVKVDPWVQFLGDHPTCSLALQLRHKMHALILRRLRAPNKPLTQGDEDIVRIVAAVLTQEEQNLGLLQPAGVGQRPRPFYSNTHNQDINGISVLGIEDSNILNSFQKGNETSPFTSSNTFTPTVTSSYTACNSPMSPSPLNNFSNLKIMSTPKSPVGSASPFDANKSSISHVAATSTSPASSSLGGNMKVKVCQPPKEASNITVSSSSVPQLSTTKTTILSCTASATSAVNVLSSSASYSTSPSTATSTMATSISSSSKTTSSGQLSEGVKTRYFIIRVGAYKQIEISQSRGLWAFLYGTERKVVQAAQNSQVILIFALNRGNQFHGFAKFWGQKTDEKCPEITNFGPPTGYLYKIEWIKKWYIHFHQARHLVNPYTDNLQVHMCRDGQEVEPSVGEQLIKVWDKNPACGGGSGGVGGGFHLMNETLPPPPPRHPLHPHGPPHPHLGPPHLHHGPPHHPHPHPSHPFPRPFRGAGAGGGGGGVGFGGGSYSGFGGSFRGAFRGGYMR